MNDWAADLDQVQRQVIGVAVLGIIVLTATIEVLAHRGQSVITTVFALGMVLVSFTMMLFRRYHVCKAPPPPPEPPPAPFTPEERAMAILTAVHRDEYRMLVHAIEREHGGS